MKLKVNRKLSIKQLLSKLPFENKYINDEVVENLKNEGPEEVDMELFKPGKYLTNQEVLEEYKSRNLEPDLGALIKLLTQQPELLEEKIYIGIQLKDNIFAYFYRSGGVRCVDVYRYADVWYGSSWFGGRKLDSKTLGSSALELLDSIEKNLKELRKLV
ncbi:MAG TPA: hypothetical protein VF974_04700 [Patescibacteria group bacterium]